MNLGTGMRASFETSGKKRNLGRIALGSKSMNVAVSDVT